MLDDMFPFTNLIVEAGVDDMSRFVAMLEEYFDLAGPDAMASLPVSLPEKTKIDIPLDIALSMLKPDDLEKLKKYVAFYLAKHGSS